MATRIFHSHHFKYAKIYIYFLLTDLYTNTPNAYTNFYRYFWNKLNIQARSLNYSDGVDFLPCCGREKKKSSCHLPCPGTWFGELLFDTNNRFFSRLATLRFIFDTEKQRTPPKNFNSRMKRHDSPINNKPYWTERMQ